MLAALRSGVGVELSLIDVAMIASDIEVGVGLTPAVKCRQEGKSGHKIEGADPSSVYPVGLPILSVFILYAPRAY